MARRGQPDTFGVFIAPTGVELSRDLNGISRSLSCTTATDDTYHRTKLLVQPNACSVQDEPRDDNQAW
jgi:hypothetical protein